MAILRAGYGFGSTSSGSATLALSTNVSISSNKGYACMYIFQITIDHNPFIHVNSVEYKNDIHIEHLYYMIRKSVRKRGKTRKVGLDPALGGRPGPGGRTPLFCSPSRTIASAKRSPKNIILISICILN